MTDPNNIRPEKQFLTISSSQTSQPKSFEFIESLTTQNFDDVQFPLTLIWENIKYSVTFKRKPADLEAQSNKKKRKKSGKGKKQLLIQDEIDQASDQVVKYQTSQVTSDQVIQIKNDSMLQNSLKSLPILRGVTGIAKGHQMVGILGPSGSGKTSLLTCLCGRQSPGKHGHFSGTIKINGLKLDREIFSKVGAFVQQDDVLLSTMTPVQCFLFAASLKLKAQTPQKRQQIISKLITQLGLTKCKDTRIGDSFIRGLSGGERKRTSIGYELITNPSLLYLDEPTSGLDSYTALSLVRLLREQSKKRGRTIVTTLHQPSSDILVLLDKVILMTSGRIAYQGKPLDILKYINSIGFIISSKFINPSDELMKIAVKPQLAHPSSSQCLQPDYLFRMYESKLGKQVARNIMNDSSIQRKDFDIDMIDELRSAGKCLQTLILIKRHFSHIMKNPRLLRAKIFQAVFTCLIAGSLWWMFGKADFSKPLSQARFNLIGVCFFFANNMSFPTAIGISIQFPSQIALYTWDQMKKLYSPTAFFWSTIGVELFFYQVYPIIMSMIFFFLGFEIEPQSFFIFLAGAMVMSVAGLSIGYFFSIAMPGQDSARNSITFIILLMMLGSGNLINIATIRPWLIFLEYISIMRYAIEIFMRAYMMDMNSSIRHSVLEQFGYTLGLDYCFFILIGISGFFLLFAWVILIIKSRYL